MKKTQRKDAFRNISKQFVSYFSIIVISMLAVTAFLGINYAADALIVNASDYMNRLHFRDVEITSTMLVTENDIEAIRNMEGISDADGVYQTSAKLLGKTNNLSVYVISAPQRISLPKIRQGHIPVSASDCALESEIMKKMGLHIGDTVEIGAVNGKPAPYLRHTTFRISGSFVHADHYAKESFASGSRYIIVTEDAFDAEALNGCFMKALVRYDKPDAMRMIGREYDALSAKVFPRLNQLAEERAAIRDAEVRGKYTERIQEGQEKLDEARQQLDDGRKKLDESAKLIATNEKTLADGKKKLDSAWKQLEAGRKKLETAKSELNAGKKKLDAAEKELKAAIDQVVSGTDYAGNSAAYTRKIKNYLAKNSVDKLDSEISELLPQEVIDSEAYQSNYPSVKSQAKQYSDGLKQYNNGLSQYNKGLSQYNQGLKQYESGMAQYRSGVKKLNNAKTELKKGEKEYAEKLTEYQDGEKKLQKAKDDLAALKECRWVVLDAESNPSYVHAKSSAENIRKLAMTFALLFVLVGILVIYATVARIIDEQRKLVGTVKALGFYNREAAVKYLLFGLSGTFFGLVLGTALSYFVLQRLVLTAHAQFYVTNGIPPRFNLPLTAAAFAAGLLIAAVSVWWACAGLVRHSAIELMKDKMPAQKVIAAPKKNGRSSLYSRLILRNIRMDIRRVCVTVVSVAGCCALLVIGFTLRHGIGTAVEKQYHEILRYDQRVVFDRNLSHTAEEDIQAFLDEKNVSYTKMHSRTVSFNAGRKITAGQMNCADRESIAQILHMTDPKTGEQVVPGEHGICIMRRTAEYYHVNVGDTVILYDASMQPYEVTVEGIYQYYTGVGFVMTKEAYQEVFGTQARDNSFLLHDCKDISGFSDELRSIKGVVSVSSNVSLYRSAMNTLTALRYIILVLIIAAGVMAYFILMNLANMYINQKKRELTVMRVNGFTTREVISYVAREAVVTTMAGILLGIGVGAVCGYLILRFVEHPGVGFYLAPSLSAWLCSAGITALYSIGIYAFSLRKVKDLKLTDIM